MIAGILYSGFITNINAQSNEEIKKLFPEEKAVTINHRNEVRFELVKGNLEIITETTEDHLLLTKYTQPYSNDMVVYSEFSQFNLFEAYTMVPDGKSFNKVPVTQFTEKLNMDDGIFFDNSREKEFVYPALSEGCHTFLHTIKTLKDPHMWGVFYFGSYIPILNTELVITVPDYVKLKYKVLNDPDNKIQFTEVKKGKKTILTWKVTNSKKYSMEEESPSAPYFVPHILINVDSYVSDGKTIKIGDSQETLFKWYQSMFKKANKTDESSLKAFADSLVRNEKTEFEKVKKVYSWVQHSIKYIAFEDGYNGFVPRDAALVFKKRYGDCKDMANILHQMLTHVGVKSYITWIGSRHLPYKHSEFPTHMADNHVIVSYYNADSSKYYFLDATTENFSIFYNADHIQGKEGFAYINDSTYKILEVPVTPASRNIFSDTVYLKIDKNIVTGKGIFRFIGYPSFSQTRRYTGLTKDKLKTTVGLGLGNNKFLFDSLNFVGCDVLGDQLSLEYWFNNPDYAISYNNQLFFNLNYDRSFKDAHVELKDRIVGIQKSYCWTEHYIYYLEIPEGYEPESIPESSSYQGDKYSYSFNYSRQGNKVILEKTFVNDFIYLSLPEIEKYNEMIKKINLFYRQSICFKPKK